MSDQRFIIEMGMGNDLEGMDYQTAAVRAITDAYSRVILPMWAALDINPDDMRLKVTVGVQEPERLDTPALAALLPKGSTCVTAVRGGQNVTNPDTGHSIVIATAAVEAFLPYQGNDWVSETY